MILLNKIVIFGDILQDGEFEASVQFYLMFLIFAFELALIYKLNNPTLERIYFWTSMLLVYGVAVLGILLSYQAKYLSKWTIAGQTELQIQLTISLIFMMRNVLLRHYLMTYCMYMITWIVVVVFVADTFEYQIIQFILGQIMYSILLAVGIHHREMLQRKSLNYERILNVEIDKTNMLISKLVPTHILKAIKNEKRQVDDFQDMTLLFCSLVGFTKVIKNAADPREVVAFLSKIFGRFDQLCEENRVYKVHTIGELYIIMAYNGRIEKSKRNREEEVDKVVGTGLEMLEIFKEYRESSTNADLRAIRVQVGIHTGRVIAGLIGSRGVWYDIFGPGVLITSKIEREGAPDRVCISEEARSSIVKRTDDYCTEFHKIVHIPTIG